MSRYYPLFLDLSDRKVLVVGGGSVALRKVRMLLRFGAVVSVAALRPAAGIKTLSRKNKVSLRQRRWRISDLEGKDIVFAATDDEELNRSVSRECIRRKIWVNVADRASLCSFIVPSIVHRGDVTFAISTGGSSPALAKFLRKKVESLFGSEIRTAAKALKRCRGKLLNLPLSERRKILRPLLNDSVLGKLKSKDTLAFEKRLEKYCSLYL